MNRRRSTHRMTAAQRHHRLATVISMGVVAVIIAGMTLWFFNLWTDELADSDGLNQSVPRCTDAIANAGGICQGGDPLPPCPTEDSDNCYWDGTKRGNLSGLSWTIEGGIATYSDGTVIDWNDR